MPRPKFTKLELQILEYLWSFGKASIREIQEAVPMRPRAARPPGTEPTAEDLAFADPARPTLYQIFDRLGLKMESSRGSAEMIIIDSLEKPAGN